MGLSFFILPPGERGWIHLPLGTPGCPRLFGSFGFASRDPPHFPLRHLPHPAHPTLHFTHTLKGFSQCFSSLLD